MGRVFRSGGLHAGVVASALISVQANACTRLFSVMSHAGAKGALTAMTMPGEGLPRGVRPDINWREHGRIGIGNNAAAYAAFVPWGVISAEDGIPSQGSSTAAIRKVRAYILSRKTQRWSLVTATNKVEGGLFETNFEDNKSRSARIVATSAATTVILDPDHPFHFWPSTGRVEIDGADVAGVVVSFQARLVGQPGASPAKYVFVAGADYWKSLSAQWNNYKTNGDAGIGRFIQLSSAWRTTYMTTASEADLNKCLS